MFPARFSVMLLLSLGSGGFISCRQYSTVERHFLRVPASTAADLSSIDRGKWLKESRKVPGFKEAARGRQQIALNHASKPERVSAPEGEVKFYPFSTGDSAAKDGAVALHWAESGRGMDPADGAGTRLYLLRTQGGRYVTEALDRLLPKELEVERFGFAQEPGTIICYRRMKDGVPGRWKKAAVLKWNGRMWSRASGAPGGG